MTNAPMDNEKAVPLSDLVTECVEDALDVLEPLDGIGERLLDLADPRVTASVPDPVRATLRELARELEDVDERASWRLDAIAEASATVAPEDA